MDFAVYRAGQLGLKLVVPLTDEWNYFHGGIQDFLGWRGQSDIQDEDNCVCNIDQHRQDVFYSHPDIIGDFKEYVRHLLDHVNPLTDLGMPDAQDAQETQIKYFQPIKTTPPSWPGRAVTSSTTPHLTGRWSWQDLSKTIFRPNNSSWTGG